MDLEQILNQIRKSLSEEGVFYCIDAYSRNYTTTKVIKCLMEDGGDLTYSDDGTIFVTTLTYYNDSMESIYTLDSGYIETSPYFRFATKEEIEEFENLVIMEEMR